MNLARIKAMAHSPVRNYVIPGLTSYLIGAPSESGCVRLFVCEREHEENIVPHSHRFDFECLVLNGSVRNRIWTEDSAGDLYQESILKYNGTMGKYERADLETPTRYKWEERKYIVGESYGMKADQIHSIFFSRGAWVLFFEGPNVSEFSSVLEPVCNGERVPTFETRKWMFERG